MMKVDNVQKFLKNLRFLQYKIILGRCIGQMGSWSFQ